MKVAIIGIGLIGGSLGLAIKAHFKGEVFVSGCDTAKKSLAIALKRGAIDEAKDDMTAAVKDADVIFLSTPVLQIVPILEKIIPHMKKGAVITDTGSTKQFIWDRLQKILPKGIYYVAGHPMAGKEHSGINAADKDLFKHKCYVIVEDTGAPKEAIDKVLYLLEATGANVTTMDIAKHDRCASVISHVPHVAAAALVTLLNQSDADLDVNLKLAGGGFKDTTRIASSNADMWSDICLTNQEAIINNLEELKKIINEMITNIEKGDRKKIYDYFAAAKKRRDQILDKTNNLFEI
jgi:prephenate dehydrogenase